MKRMVATVVIVLCGWGSCWGALSGNLIRGGDFEDPTAIKTDNLGTGRRPWQFNNNYTQEQKIAISRENDVGYWIGSYGAMTHYDDPRSLWPGTHIDFANTGEGMGCTNVSLVSGDHVMETTGFRSVAFQIVEAPALQKPGTGSMSFDYFWKIWSTDDYAFTRFRVRVYGLTQLPDFWDGYQFDGDAPYLTGETLLAGSPVWDNEWMDWIEPEWHITEPPDPPQWQSYARTFELAQTFPYYYILYQGVLYHEGHLYFNDEAGRPADEFALAWDDVSLRLPVALLADTNLDGLRNALDIQSFVARVTGSLPYMIEADCNQDGLVNALDIQKFVYYITGGTGSVVPEPASLGWLAAAGLALFRRR